MIFSELLPEASAEMGREGLGAVVVVAFTAMMGVTLLI